MDLLHWTVQNRQSLQAFWPETLLLGTSVAVLLLGAFRKVSTAVSVGLGLLGLAAFALSSLSLLTFDRPALLFSGAIVADPFAVFFKFLFAAVSAVTLLMAARSEELRDHGLAEVTAFVLALTVGMSMMAAATDMLMMYLSLEMVSVLSYVLVGFRRHNRASSEAGLKYILYGAFASGVMVFGLSYLFGLSGSTALADLARTVAGMGDRAAGPVVLLSLLCVMTGFGYKIATFPTQMWCPDVYQGAPLPVTAFLSVGPKAAGFAMMMRFFVQVFDVSQGRGVPIFEFVQWDQVLAVLAAVTMSVGNFAAIPQRNLKRLMAYSSIAHAGYLLMGFSALTSQGVEAVLFYLVTYLLMNLGAFLIILFVADRLGTEEIDGYRGLGYRAPFVAMSLAVFLFSLTGLPPFAGFVGKLFLFGAVIQQKIHWLAVVAALNTVVSLFYYARILRTMYLDSPLETSDVTVSVPSKAFALALSIPTLVLGIYWEPVLRWVERSVGPLFG